MNETALAVFCSCRMKRRALHVLYTCREVGNAIYSDNTRAVCRQDRSACETYCESDCESIEAHITKYLHQENPYKLRKVKLNQKTIPDKFLGGSLSMYKEIPVGISRCK